MIVLVQFLVEYNRYRLRIKLHIMIVRSRFCFKIQLHFTCESPPLPPHKHTHMQLVLSGEIPNIEPRLISSGFQVVFDHLIM